MFPADVSFLCDEAAVFVEAIKGSLRVIYHLTRKVLSWETSGLTIYFCSPVLNVNVVIGQ
jgi:hypothetical protein